MELGDKRAYQAVAIGAMALMLGLTAGYYAGQGSRQEQEEPPREEAAANGEEQPGAEVSTAERFEVFSVNIFECGHILERDEGRAVTGPEAEAALKELGGYTYELSGGRMALYREFAYCCPEHYYTGLEGSEAAVYCTDGETLEKRLVCTLPLEPESQAYEEAAAGMVFATLEEVNIYMEGLEE